MAKGTGRKCSNCGDNGHNSRTCNEKGTCVKLFGVNIGLAVKHQNKQTSLHKSFRMGHLQFHAQNNNINGAVDDDDGYLSEGQIHSKKHKAARQVKRGEPWTQKEHRMFLEGLNNLGRGDWRGISKNYVTSRTPVQVASHAQKYFLRLTANDNKKRRQSLFDMPFPQSQSEEVTPDMMQPLPFLNYARTSHGYIGKALANVAVHAPDDHPSPPLVQDDTWRADPCASLPSHPFIRLI